MESPTEARDKHGARQHVAQFVFTIFTFKSFKDYFVNTNTLIHYRLH